MNLLFITVPLKPTPLLTIWSLLLFLFISSKYYKSVLSYCYSIGEKIQVSNLLPFFVLFFAITGFCNGDFYHTAEELPSIRKLSDVTEYCHYEAVYQYISAFVGGNYWLWRTIVWGSVCLLVALSSKRLGVNYKVTLYIMFVMYAIQYSYARSSLAQSLYFFGVTFLIKPWKNKVLSYVLGFLILFQAPLFHRSLWGLVAISPVFLLPNFLDRKGWLKMVAYIAVLVFIVVRYSNLLFSFDFSLLDDTDTLEKYVTTYAENEGVRGFNPGKFLLDIFKHVSYLGVAFIVTKSLLRMSIQDIKVEQQLYKYYIAILVISYTLSFLGAAFYTFSYRLMIMSFIPCTLLISRMWQRGILRKNDFRWILYLAGTNSLATILYSVYCAL